jgi:hypothetical protein
MKCNETLSKWCKNKHGASKIMDTLETYHSRTSPSSPPLSLGTGRAVVQATTEPLRPRHKIRWLDLSLLVIELERSELTESRSSSPTLTDNWHPRGAYMSLQSRETHDGCGYSRWRRLAVPPMASAARSRAGQVMLVVKQFRFLGISPSLLGHVRRMEA